MLAGRPVKVVKDPGHRDNAPAGLALLPDSPLRKHAADCFVNKPV